MTHLFRRGGRLHMAWYVLRGHTVVYRATIRDGGLNLRDRGKAIIQEVQIYGADVGLHVNASDRIHQLARSRRTGRN